MAAGGDGGKFGTLRGDLSFVKDRIDFGLTRFPRIYLAVERHREWVNWDKRIYLSFVRSGETVLDVGANVGAHTVFFSHLVGPRGRVYSFEPVPANVTAMRALVAKRVRFDNVTIVESAVGNPEFPGTRVTLMAPSRDLSQASLAPQRAGSWESAAEVHRFDCRITRIDDAPELRDVDHAHFIKLDIEGAELDALKGSERLIRRNHPLVYCEAYERWMQPFGYSPLDLIRYAHSLGYAGARVISRGQVYPLRLGAEAPNDWFATSSDILFFGESHAEAVRRFDRRYGVRPA